MVTRCTVWLFLLLLSWHNFCLSIFGVVLMMLTGGDGVDVFNSISDVSGYDVLNM